MYVAVLCMYNVLYIQKTHHDLFLSGPILHRKCSVRNKMFRFALALNLNLHSGSCPVKSGLDQINLNRKKSDNIDNFILRYDSLLQIDLVTFFMIYL